jgi:threonine/homoserine/homoserine lactone efflux protein
MLSPEQFFAFLLAALLITASPGPDNLMVLGMGISKGAARAWPSAWAAPWAA